MVPADFIPYFAASAGAGAALIGLLFVAITVAPERLVAGSAPLERREVAGSAFTALVNAFFISFLALVPGDGFFGVIMVMSTLALLNSVLMAWRLLRHRTEWQNVLRRAILVAASLFVYGFEFSDGLALVRNPHDISAVFGMTYLLGAVYGIGLTRAWQLLGARRTGLSSWLSILNDVDDTASEHGAPVPTTAAPAASATAAAPVAAPTTATVAGESATSVRAQQHAG